MTNTPSDINTRCSVFWANVEYFKDMYHITNREIARILGCSEQTIINRHTHPRQTTLEEVVKIASKFGIDEPASLLVPMIPSLPRAIDTKEIEQ